MQICQLQLEFLRNGSMVGLVHVVLAITLVSFTKTLSGDTHLNLVKAQFGFNQLISNFKFNSLRLSTNQNQETLLDSLCINRLETICIFIHLHTRSLKPHPSSNQYPLDNANNLPYSREQKHVSVSDMYWPFQIAYEGDFRSLCTVTFGLKVDFLNSNTCQCSRLYGTQSICSSKKAELSHLKCLLV